MARFETREGTAEVDDLTRQSEAAPAPEHETKDYQARDEERLARARKIALRVAEVGLEKKALNIEIIDVYGKVDYTDYLVLMTGRSDRQVQAVARGIEETLKEKDQIGCSAVEGLPVGNWVLMDFGDVVVHVFHEEARGFYDLDSLWIDAARVPMDAELAS